VQHHGIEATYPATPLQAGLLFHSLAAEGEGLYVQQLVGRLHEDLDTSALAEAWRRIVQRHAVLRTSFRLDRPERPIQVVSQSAVAPVETRDWRGLPAPAREEELQRLLRADREAGFELENGPLSRLHLCRGDEHEYHLVWSYHHALIDGRSRVIVLGELFALYEALRERQPFDLPEPRPFRDFVEWLETRDWRRAEAFWHETLRGIDDPTPLPPPVPAPADGGARGPGEHLLRVPAATVRKLNRLARRHDLTLGTILHGAWAALVSREADRDDVVFGVTRAGRRSLPFPTDSMVGLLMATVPVRARLRADASLADWLGELRAQSVAMREFEHASLADIQRWSGVPRPRPLFESVLTFERPSTNSVLREQSDEFRSRDFQVIERGSYPLAARFQEQEQDLVVLLRFDGKRVDSPSAERMLAGYGELLEVFARRPETRVGDLDPMSAAERFRLVHQWNETDAPYERDASIHELFERQAQRRPDAVAVELDHARLTYAELDGAANRVAWRLRDLGVGHETLVAVAMERSLEVVIAFLGVLKADAAYVPLDPDDPGERLAFMLRDTAAPVLLTQSRLVDRLPRHGAAMLCLDPALSGVPASRSVPPPSQAGATSRAYVMFTSGSTGQPKGVEVLHRGVVRLVRGTDYVELGEDDAVLQFAPLWFDRSTFEIWAPLLNGGRLVLAPARLPSVVELGRLMRHHGVTIARPATGLFHELVDAGLEDLRGVRQLLPGADVLSPTHAARADGALPETRIVNAYGPTESTTTASAYVIPADLDEHRSVPIGRPIANTRLYVLDSRRRAVPVGVPGELYIGGDGLARGYLNRPELTAERFVPNPFGAGRLYRTGDRARHRPDGQLEFLGRVDHQLKIRGFRVEPGEVEAALTSHPGVASSVVVAREHRPGSKRLVAYVVWAPGHRPDEPSLRHHVAARLPKHMIPAAIVPLPALPLTSNGKVDRRALPAPELPTGAAQLPRTRTEKVLAAIWEQVLHRSPIGAHDDFFELGGDSLVAMQISGAVTEALGVEVPVDAVFDTPTVAGLAARAEQLGARGAGARLPPIRPAQRDDAVPLAGSQKQLWFIDQLEPANRVYCMQRLLCLEGALDVPALERALTEIVHRHEILRTTFAARHGEPRQVVHPGWEVRLVPVEPPPSEAERPEGFFERLAEQAVFELDRLPLVRWTLVRLAPRRHALVYVQHHITNDGWSWTLLLRELSQLYAAFSAGEESPLTKPELQFADFALWQRRLIDSPLGHHQLAYWSSRLRPSPPVLELPFDHPRPARRGFRGGTAHATVPAELAEGLRRLGRTEGATTFMTTLAALLALLHRWSGQEDLCVGTVVANRRRPESRTILGMLAHPLALRTDLSGDPTVRELLRRVREVTLGAYAHQDVPFHEVLRVARPQRTIRHAPLYQTMFGFHDAPDFPQPPGLAITAEILWKDTARADLSVIASRRAGAELSLSWEYNRDLFEPATGERMLRHYEEMLEAIVAEPDLRLSELSSLEAAKV
jgi:amino acid adenylation domain-containing protein